MKTSQYTIALMLFFAAYIVFEAPSNLALKFFKPSRWLGFLVFGFGAFCTALAGSNNFATVSVLRFFLGAVEAYGLGKFRANGLGVPILA